MNAYIQAAPRLKGTAQSTTQNSNTGKPTFNKVAPRRKPGSQPKSTTSKGLMLQPSAMPKAPIA